MLRAKILSWFGALLLSLWSRSIRIHLVHREILDGIREAGDNFILAFWHGRQFLLFPSHRNSGFVVPASESRDGEIQAGILRRFGGEVVRGSSKRKGDRALMGLVDGLRKGKNIALAVDGPRGPIYEVKRGVVYLAGKLGKPIVPLTMGARRFWILEKIWDKFVLPVPFTKGVVLYGQPITVQGTSEEELDRKSKEVASALHAISREADEYFQKKQRA